MSNKKIIGTIAVVIGILYLMIAFVKLDLNAAHWEEGVRFCYCTFSVISSMIIIMFNQLNK